MNNILLSILIGIVCIILIVGLFRLITYLFDQEHLNQMKEFLDEEEYINYEKQYKSIDTYL